MSDLWAQIWVGMNLHIIPDGFDAQGYRLSGKVTKGNDFFIRYMCILSFLVTCILKILKYLTDV